MKIRSCIAYGATLVLFIIPQITFAQSGGLAPLDHEPLVIGGGECPGSVSYDPNTGICQCTYVDPLTNLVVTYDDPYLVCEVEYTHPRLPNTTIDFTGACDLDSGDMAAAIEAALGEHCSADLEAGCSFIDGDISGSCIISMDGRSLSCAGSIDGEGWSLEISLDGGSLGNLEFTASGCFVPLDLSWIDRNFSIGTIHCEDPLNPGHIDPEISGCIGLEFSW